MILKKLHQVSRIKTSVTKRVWRKRRRQTHGLNQMHEFFSDLYSGAKISVEILSSGEAKVLVEAKSGRIYPMSLPADLASRLTTIARRMDVPVEQLVLRALNDYLI